MLAIRMQRTGRKGHAMFRVVVQEASLTPSSGKVVAALGNYDPHSKVANLVKDKAAFYLEHGAQPSPRIASLFEREGIALPAWVKKADPKQGKLRNPAKLRRNQPKEVVAPVAETVVAEEVTEAPEVAAPAEETPAEPKA